MALSALHVTKNTTLNHTATVIFFHGSGGNGGLMQEWVKLLLRHTTMSFPHIKIVYPTAPLIPYTPLGGELSNVWFDRIDISPRVPEHSPTLDQIKIEVRKLFEQENKLGISNNRIIVGGFSMGGALALHTAYRFEPSIAGVFAFSSFLNDGSVVYEKLANADKKSLPQLLQLHGDNDEVVPLEWGRETFNNLQKLGVSGEFSIQPRLQHSINGAGLQLIKYWIEKLLPE